MSYVLSWHLLRLWGTFSWSSPLCWFSFYLTFSASASLLPFIFEGWCILWSHFWLFCSTHFLLPLPPAPIIFLSSRPLITNVSTYACKYFMEMMNSHVQWWIHAFISSYSFLCFFFPILIHSGTIVHSEASQKLWSCPVFLFLHCSCLYQQALLILFH